MRPPTIAGLGALAGRVATIPDGSGTDGELARRHIFDTLCATHVGALTPDGRALAAVVASLDDRPPAIASQITAAVGACRATECDDIHPGAAVTPGAVAVGVALATAARRGIGDEAVLAAVVAGYETGVHLGRAIGGPAAMEREIWPTYLVAPVIAAAVVARLSHHDASMTETALELAAARSRAALPVDQPGRPARWLAIGLAAAEGLTAAAAAAAGIRAAPLASDRESFDDAWREADLDGTAAGTLAEVEFKSFAGARQALAPLTALLSAIRSHTDGPAPAAVRLFVPEPFHAMLTEDAHDRWSSLCDLRLQAALAIESPDRLWDPVRAGGWTPADASLLARIAIIGDPALTAQLPDRWAGRAEVTWPGGERTPASAGEPLPPLGWEQLTEKWTRVLAVLGRDSAWIPRAAARCRDLATRPDAASAGALWTLTDPSFDDHDKEQPLMSVTVNGPTRSR